MQRLLVTGAAGFIGANVVAQLLDRGDEVVGLDNLNDAYDPLLKEWRLTRLRGRTGFQFVQADICDRAALAELFAAQESNPPFDAVINLAARAGVRPSVSDPWTYFRTNTDGTLNLLDLCRQHGVRKFVLASTSSLYGGHNPIPFREDTDTNRPLSPYAASKKGAEAIAYTYHHLHGLDITIPRYFTVYGPAGRPDMSVFRFVRLIAEGRPITVFGDGQQSRDFTFVEDIARGTVAALRPVGFEVVNLGGDRPLVLSELIDQIGQLVGKTPVIRHQPAHPADVPATWASIDKARQILDWSPRVSVEDGLRAAVEWYQCNRDLALSLDLGE